METSTAQNTGDYDNHDAIRQQYFSFIVDNQEYAVDILRVQEIRGWTGARHVPTLPPYIKGVIDLRGGVVPIIDLRERLGMPILEYTNLTVVVILNIIGTTGEKMVGIVVDAVSDVLDVDDSQLKPPPDFGADIETDFVNHLATVDDRMVILLDIDKLLGTDMPSHIPTRADPVASAPPEHHDAPQDKGKPQETIDEVVLLENSFNALAPQGKEIVHRFYDVLFQRYPDVKPLFNNTDRTQQEKKLLAALQIVINNLRQPDKLEQLISDLGQKHQAYGAKAEHYDAVATVLLEVLAKFAGPLWTSEVKQAWKNALGSIKELMLSAYNQSAANETVLTDDGGLTATQIELLERSFNLLAPQALELVSRFYAALFKRYPDVKPMFANTDPKEQKKKLIAALQLVINNLRNPKKLGAALEAMGKKHQHYGALPAHYDAVAGTLLETMSDMAGDNWTDDVDDAWQAALLAVKEGMLAGYD